MKDRARREVFQKGDRNDSSRLQAGPKASKSCVDEAALREASVGNGLEHEVSRYLPEEEAQNVAEERVRNFGERTAGIFAKYRLDSSLTLEETIKAERECFEQALVEDAQRLDFE